MLLGKAGEEAVRAAYKIGDKIPIRINGRRRIPDGLTDEVLSEVKNVKKLSFTRQLRDFIEFAEKRRPPLRVDLYIRSNTELSKPLLDAIRSGRINPLIIPGT